MTDKRVGVYAGFDPTGPSMHVGHLLPFMVLLWFYVHGYSAVSLVCSFSSPPSSIQNSFLREVSHLF